MRFWERLLAWGMGKKSDPIYLGFPASAMKVTRLWRELLGFFGDRSADFQRNKWLRSRAFRSQPPGISSSSGSGRCPFATSRMIARISCTMSTAGAAG